MARVALTKDEVMVAFEKLIAEGSTPSAENIHALLGKGSIGMINRYIKEIIDENNHNLLQNRNGETKSAKADTTEIPPEANMESPAAHPPKAVESHHNHKRIEERRHEPDMPEAPLESLSEQELVIKIRRLESMLLKEQARREASERVALDTQTYADNIKEQVSERISDIRQAMELVIEQLKQQIKEQKQNYELDLKFYREQLDKANKKLTELLGS